MIAAVKVSEERRLKLETANANWRPLRIPFHTICELPASSQGLALALTEDHGQTLQTEARDYLERIMTASGRMDSLIRDLLEYSRISRVDFDLSPVDLQPVLTEAQASVTNTEAGGSR